MAKTPYDHGDRFRIVEEGVHFIRPGEPLPPDPYADARETKRQAEYVAKSLTDRACRDCEHFVSPGSCELVAGTISPEGVCKHFEAADPIDRSRAEHQAREKRQRHKGYAG